MADRNGLGMIGVMLGAATLLVLLVGSLVVGETMTGRVQIDDSVGAVTLPAAAR